jgi:hypothetical protein
MMSLWQENKNCSRFFQPAGERQNFGCFAAVFSTNPSRKCLTGLMVKMIFNPRLKQQVFPSSL